MSPYTRRLVGAAVLSLCGIGATYGWYRYEEALSLRHDDSQKLLLAHLETAKNDVQKRQKGRVIWKHVDETEPLYAGESIRTSSDSEAKIRFVSGAEVELDADSVVAIEATGGKPNLDFISGNIFVKGGAGGEQGSLSLKSGTASIDVNNADLS